jgi:glucose-1-phosphate adenylyltransferase
MLSSSEIPARTLVFVLAGGQGRRLFPLTRDRAKPAVPFGRIYRLIDFTISNCLNSGLRQIHILTEYQCESLHSYMRDFGRNVRINNSSENSLICLCPSKGSTYRGTADALFQNFAILQKANADTIVILSGDHIYRMDYRKLIAFHLNSGAGVTVAAVECPLKGASEFGILETDSQGRIVGFEEKPSAPRHIPGKPSTALASMGVYVFNKQTLADALVSDAQRQTDHDFGKSIIPELVRSNLAWAYNFSEAPTHLGSYWRDVGTIDAYYRANTELLLDRSLDSYEDAAWPLFSVETRTRLAHELTVERGSRVTDSVLSPGVQIDGSAVVKSSILLHNVYVGAGARIQRAIVDENVRIGEGVTIGFDSVADRKIGFVTQSGIVVIPRNTSVSDL